MSIRALDDDGSGASYDGANQYLSFRLGDSTYAFAVTITREITEISSITPIPHAPDWVCGLISLRGTIVPVLNIKKKLQIPDAPLTADARVIILEVPIQTEVFVFGVLADSVQNVVEIQADKLAPPPRYDTRLRPTSILGVGHAQERLILVLDAERVFLEREVEAIPAAPSPTTQAQTTGDSAPAHQD